MSKPGAIIPQVFAMKDIGVCAPVAIALVVPMNAAVSDRSEAKAAIGHLVAVISLGTFSSFKFMDFMDFSFSIINLFLQSAILIKL